MRYCFGIDIGGTTIKCGLFTQDGEVVRKWEIPTNREAGGGKIPGELAASIAGVMGEEHILQDQTAWFCCART